MDTFSPAINPSINGTQVSITPRLIATTFGDGYKQTAPDGLNVAPFMPTLVWASIDSVNGNNILYFMLAHVGVTFYYTLPNETTPRKFQWNGGGSYSFLSASVMSLTFPLEEHFDLAG